MKLFVRKLIRKIRGSAYSAEELRSYGGTEAYIERNRKEMREDNTWHTPCAEKSDEEKKEMVQVLSNTKTGFDV